MNFYTHQLFSKVVFETQLDYSKKELNNFINTFKKFKIKDTTEIKHNTKASETKYILNNKKFKSLKNNLLKQFNLFKNNVLKYENTNFDITTSWLAISNEKDLGISHNHRNSFYSGIFYLKTPENCGDVQFQNYDSNNFYIEPTVKNSYNSTQWQFKVKENLLLFFPSELYHTILKNNSKSNRISLAFNIVPKGRFGCSDSELHIMPLDNM